MNKEWEKGGSKHNYNTNYDTTIILKPGIRGGPPVFRVEEGSHIISGTRGIIISLDYLVMYLPTQVIRPFKNGPWILSS